MANVLVDQIGADVGAPVVAEVKRAHGVCPLIRSVPTSAPHEARVRRRRVEVSVDQIGADVGAGARRSGITPPQGVR